MKAHFTALSILGLAILTNPGLAQAQPEIHSITDSVPASWNMPDVFDMDLPTVDRWWRRFQDPILVALIDKAESANYDVRIASKRIQLARLAVDQSRSGLYPNFSVSGGWQTAQNAGATVSDKNPSTRSSAFTLAADMSWEIDLFGRISAETKAKRSAWNASKMEYAGTMVSVASNVAQYYFQLREYQALLAMVKEHLASQQEVTRITEVRFETGLSSMLDVTQARIVLYTTQSQIPGIEANITNCINSISLLLGTYPEEIDEWLREVKPLPNYVQGVRVGIPADLIRRRPDVVEAEYQVREAAAQIGIAKKDYLPTLAIQGSFGTSSHNFDHLFHKNAYSYSIGPTLSWTIFDGFSRNLAVKEAQQNMEISLDDYNLAVLTAIHEVNSAMTQYAADVEAIKWYEKVMEESRHSFDLSLDLYKQGLSPFSDVMTAQQNFLSNSTSFTQTQGQALVDLVALYKALGGGWKNQDE